jgi:uncharacterized membrane protein
MAITVEHPETTLGKLLRAGVLISAAIVLAGAIWFLSRHGHETPDYRRFHGEPAELSSVGGILRGAFSGHSRNLIQLGLLAMIATPVARVGLSIALFALERDRLYVVLTCIVFAVLLASLFWQI